MERSIKILKKEGILDTSRKRITIMDPETLQSYSSSATGDASSPQAAVFCSRKS